MKEIRFNTGPTLSLCMIVKNEEDNLKRYFEKFYKGFDEVIVVDTGSTDGTVGYLESLDNIKIVKTTWEDDFAKARNIGIDAATGEYIIWMDADDFINPQDIIVIKNHLKNNPNTAAFLRLIDLRFDIRLDSVQLRIFPRNDQIRFEGRIHEQVSNSLDKLNIQYSNCEIPIIHYGYNTQEAITIKLKRNIKILLDAYKEDPNDFFNVFSLARTALNLGYLQPAIKYLDIAIDLYESGKVEKIIPDIIVTCYIIRASLLEKEGRGDEANEILIKLKEKFPDNMTLNYTIGEQLYKNKKYKEAYPILKRVLEDNDIGLSIMPINFEILFSSLKSYLITCALHVGDYDLLEVLFRDLTKDETFTVFR